MPRKITVRLDVDEERVTTAHRELIGLGAALVHQPFDTAVHDKLRVWLTDEAAQVLDSLEALRARPEHALRARIAELIGQQRSPFHGEEA